MKINGSQHNPRVPVSVLGIPFDPVTTAGTVERIEAMIASRQPHYLVTANVDFLVQARSDIELRRILLEADLVLCDGTPVVWASALFGNRLPERVAGSDLVPELVRVSAGKGYRLFFLGASEEAGIAAVARLMFLHPNLKIVGHYSPPYSPLLQMDHEEIRRRIVRARPDILLVCFGCPKQEKWIAMNYRDLGVPVAAGVGGTLDFLAGQRRRAPVWMRQTGLEWVYRLAQEPRRLFRRYAHDLAAFGWGMGVQTCALGRCRNNTPKTPALQFFPGDSAVRLELPAILDVQAAHQLAGIELHPGQCWLLDGSRVASVDSSGLAWLSTFGKRTRARCIVLVNPSPRLQRVLRRMQLASLFHTAPDLQRGLDLARSQTVSEPVWVSRSPSSGGTTVRFHGEITAGNAARVWVQAQGHLYGIQPGQVWKFDLQEVPFIDTTGLQLMSRAADTVRRAGATPDFNGMCREVMNVIQHGRMQDALLGDKRLRRAAQEFSPVSAG